MPGPPRCRCAVCRLLPGDPFTFGALRRPGPVRRPATYFARRGANQAVLDDPDADAGH